MPKPLQKSLQKCLSKIKKPPNRHINLPSKTLSSSTSWILRGCKHPKTLSFAFDRNLNEGCNNADHEAATLADIDRFLFENFKSLYLKDEDEEKKGDKEDDEERTGGFTFESHRFIDPPQDLCGSHRFFVAPGSSGSLMEEARTSATTSSTTAAATTNDSTTGVGDGAKQEMGPDDFIAVFTFSPSPYDDFGQSMQEMIEARMHHHGKVDWEFMEELLFCYLNVNDKKSYKYILSAFVDLIVILRENSGKVPVRSRQAGPVSMP